MGIKHLETNTKLVRVGNGQTFRRTTFYCAVHGEFDSWLFDGDKASFDARHTHCDQPPTVRGAEFEKALAKTV